MDHLLELKNITQSYNKQVILQDLTLSISQNQSIAFTGHNGCGKSTLLKLLAGLIRPTHGNVLYYGAPLFHYVPERFPKMNLTARQYLRHMGYLDGLSTEDVKTRYKALCEEFFLSDMLDIPIKHLSKGTLQKVSVIQALLKTPDVLILDEPLSGQDTDSQKVFIDTMNMLRKNGCTLLMSCHEMNLVNSISDTVYEIRDKQLQKTDMSNNYIRENDVLLFQPPTGNGSHIMDIPAGFTAEEKGPFVEVTVPDGESRELILLLLHKGWELKQLYHEGKIM